MLGVPQGLQFNQEGLAWPHRHASRFVTAFGSKWHVQELSQEKTGPAIVLLHGTGASTHSWRDIMPLLAETHRVVAFDLPGHGFSQSLSNADPTLMTMEAAVRALLAELAIENPVLIGHSAGAAIALQLALDQSKKCAAVISINGALYPFPGAASSIFPLMAKMLFLNPFTPHLFALGATGKHRVKRLLEGTGSELDEKGLGYYQTLFKNAGHVRATLAWMANWDLEPLSSALPDYQGPFLQIIGGEDRTIPPGNAYETAQRLKQAETKMMSGYGHLVHEEQPDRVASQIVDFLARTSALSQSS